MTASAGPHSLDGGHRNKSILHDISYWRAISIEPMEIDSYRAGTASRCLNISV